MTQEQKQFITKALITGIPAIAQEHIAALNEVERIAGTPSDKLNGQERFEVLNQEVYNVTVKVLRASAPYMASEYIEAYNEDVNVCNAKFAENIQAREEKEKAEAEKAEKAEAPADKPVPAKKKKNA